MIKKGDTVKMKCNSGYAETTYTIVAVFQNVNDKKDCLVYVAYKEKHTDAPRTAICTASVFEVVPKKTNK